MADTICLDVKYFLPSRHRAYPIPFHLPDLGTFCEISSLRWWLSAPARSHRWAKPLRTTYSAWERGFAISRWGEIQRRDCLNAILISKNRWDLPQPSAEQIRYQRYPRLGKIYHSAWLNPLGLINPAPPMCKIAVFSRANLWIHSPISSTLCKDPLHQLSYFPDRQAHPYLSG